MRSFLLQRFLFFLVDCMKHLVGKKQHLLELAFAILKAGPSAIEP